MSGAFCWGSVILLLLALALVLPAQGITNGKIIITPKVGCLGMVILALLSALSLVLAFVFLLK